VAQQQDRRRFSTQIDRGVVAIQALIRQSVISFIGAIAALVSTSSSLHALPDRRSVSAGRS